MSAADAGADVRPTSVAGQRRLRRSGLSTVEAVKSLGELSEVSTTTSARSTLSRKSRRTDLSKNSLNAGGKKTVPSSKSINEQVKRKALTE